MADSSPLTCFYLKCPDKNCQETFSRLSDLHNHLFFVHNKVKQECPICQQKFATFKLLRLHEKTHGEYQCSDCGQRFIEKGYLKLHMKTHDSERELFVCDLCGKSFKHKGNLQVHIKSKHEKRKFKCMLCDRELSTKQKLDEHMSKRHKMVEEDLEIDLNEFEEFEKEWAAKREPLDLELELTNASGSKRIKLEPLSKEESDEQIADGNYSFLESDLEFLYS